MTTRTRREIVTFKHPARIKGVDRIIPAGSYEIVTDEEMIEGISYPVYRRVATLILLPSERGSSMEMISIGSIDLSDAQLADVSMP
ncbi:hypothetical protein V1291_002605 [Nitrobacteraceae bacterium AZCC 1564]